MPLLLLLLPLLARPGSGLYSLDQQDEMQKTCRPGDTPDGGFCSHVLCALVRCTPTGSPVNRLAWDGTVQKLGAKAAS